MAIELRSLVKSIRVVTDGDSSGYVKSLNEKVAADQRAIASDKQVAGSLESIDRKLNDTGSRYERLARQLDPTLAAQQKFEAGSRTLQRALDNGNISADRHAQLMQQLERRYTVTNDNLRQSGAAANAATVSTGQLRFALQSLGSQIGDVGAQLASGASPFRIMLQQGDQFRMAFAAGGGVTATLAAVKASISNMVTPSNLAAAGLVAVAAGAAAVLAHAGKIETQAKSFAVSTEAMGTASLAAGADFQKMVRDLQAIGVAADDARTSLLEVVRTPGVNPAAAGRIVATGANIAAGSGGDAVARAKELAAAVSQGAEALISYGVATHTLDTIQAGALRTFTQMNGEVAGASRAFDQIEQTVSGRLNRTLGTTARTLADVKSAFGSMWDALAITGPAQTGIKALEHVANVITALSQGKPLFLNLPGLGQIALNDAAAQARLSAQTGATINPGAASLPGATNTFDTRGLDLNTDALQRLSAVMDAAVKHLPEGYALVATSTVAGRPGTPGSDHPQGLGMDVQLVGPNGPLPNKGPIGSDPGMYERLAAAAYLENQRLFPGTPLAWGGRFETKAGSGLLDWMHFGASEDRGRFGPPLAQVAARYQPQSISASAADAPFATVAPASQVTAGYDPKVLDELGKQIALREKLLQADRMTGASKVWWQEYWQAVGAGTPKVEEVWAAMAKANDAEQAWRISIEKGTAVEKLRADGALATGRAILQGEVPGLQAAAEAQAALDVRNGNAIDLASRKREILTGAAAEEIQAAAQATASLRQQTEQAELLGAATQKGAGAEHDATLAAQASTATRTLLNRAQAAGIPITDGVVAAITAETVALTRRNDAAKNAAELGRAANDNRSTLAIVQLETSLQGQTTEYIQAQVSHLQAIQELERRREPLTSDVAQNYLKSVDALSQARIQAAEVSRETQRWDDTIRSVISSVEGALTNAIEAAFSGQKVDDWGKRIKSMLSSIAAQAVDALFIRPALGTLAGLAGFGNVASQLGSFGSLLGGGSGQTLTGTVGGQPATFSLSNITGGASLLKDVFGIDLGGSGSGGLFSGVKDFFSGGLGGIFAHTPTFGGDFGGGGELGIAAGTGQVPGSIFGSTTFGSALGGIGAGFSAGMLLNSVTGGNTLTGSIGSGIGSLAGAVIGSIIPGIGTLIGGLGGGAAGSIQGDLFRKDAAA